MVAKGNPVAAEDIQVVAEDNPAAVGTRLEDIPAVGEDILVVEEDNNRPAAAARRRMSCRTLRRKCFPG